MAPRITLHHLENSRSLRITWLLAELGLEYELVEYKRDARTKWAPDALREIHPLGKSPVLVIEDQGEKYTLAESSAIIQFILDNYAEGRLQPPTSDKRGRADLNYWLHYSEAGIMIPVLGRMWASIITGDSNNPAIKKVIDPKLKDHTSFIESTLGKHPYFSGQEFSATDIAMVYALLNISTKELPNVQAWLGRVTERPAYKEAVKRGGPVDPRAFTPEARKQTAQL